MGGFLLFDENSSQINHKLALNIFERKNQKVLMDKKYGRFRLITYSKRSFQNENYYQFNDNEFIALIGIPIYKKLSGEKAALKLYDDLSKNININFADFCGHFCCIALINGKLSLFNDYNGMYHVYHDSENKIFSNSFLAVVNSLQNKKINLQGLYEYVFLGSTFGSDTILENIKLLDNKKIIELDPQLLLTNKNFNKKDDMVAKFDEVVEIISADLISYFEVITKNYDQFNLGLSGGFDSRLILSLLLKCNIKPDIYTNGNPNSTEVAITRSISKTFGLNFNNFYEKETLPLDNDAEENFAEEKFYLDEGLNLFGIFYSSTDEDLIRSQKIKTNLNGMGGEIYRNKWNLPNKKFSPKNFILAKYDDFQVDIATPGFNKSLFLENFTGKIVSGLDIESSESKLSRELVELIFPTFRIRYWAAKICSKLNQYCFALMPYSDPILYSKSIYIPYKHKVAGKLQSALIKKINPELAKFNSNYKFNFYDGPDLKSKTIDLFKINAPIKLRRLLRKKKKVDVRTSDLGIIKEKEKLFFNNDLYIRKYINLNYIETKDMYSRALTLEYFIRKCL